MADTLSKSKFRLKDLPASERPQERLERLGARALSDRELLAMVLRSGTSKCDVLNLASLMIEKAGSLAGLVRWDISDFQQLPGIGCVKALQLSVYIEIAHRISQGNRLSDPILDEPRKVWNLISSEALSESVEKVWVLCLDRKNRLLRLESVTSGTATSSLVHPREVFRPAIRWGATAVILAHNHPSGDPSPSSSDLNVTRKILDASKCVDLDFHDHVIIGEKTKCPNGLGYYSFSENGFM
jgi:DNA repair protein RadC